MRVQPLRRPIVASVTAILIGMATFSWDKPAALLLALLGAFIVTADKPGKGEPIEHSRR